MKSDKTTRVGSHGVSALGVAQIVFIILKLVGVIDWSWWAVLIPMWISIGGAILFVLIFFGYALWRGLRKQ